MAIAVRWIVIIGLFLSALVLPAAWLGSPRDAFGLGLFLGGMTMVVLDSILNE